MFREILNQNMLKPKTLFLLALFFATVAIFALISLERGSLSSYYPSLRDPSPEETILPRSVGEKITYDVMLGKVRLGQAYFSNLPNVEVDGRKLNLITFETRLARFADREEIYSDPKTLLPIKVNRDIKKWFVSERITEEYDQGRYLLKIIKNKGDTQQQMIIQSGSHIHNAVLLPYYVRRIPKLKVGWSLQANFPLRKFLIKLVSIDSIVVPAGTFQAYHFISEPKQFQIWISLDERRIPIKIVGTGMFGYSLEMSKYSHND
ncbi:hypothetical protein D4R78_00760 [bacterium]|nr:MAG: hypothetical protein D4R78_00760 [bacterium]